MRGATAIVFSVFLGMAIPGTSAAQDDEMKTEAPDALALADSLAHSGRTEEARALLIDWWDLERSDAPRDRLEHATWLRALLTVDPEQARLEYRRLVVEFPGGRYVGASLARIARLSAAAGDTTGARNAWESLLREHSGSPEAEVARAWLDAYTTGVVGEGGNLATVEEAPPSDREGVGPTLGHAVQLGAFNAVQRAQELVQRARDAGLEPRVVRVSGSDLIRVRLGRFGAESDARDLYGRVRDLGFDALIVDDAEDEAEIPGLS